MFKKILLIKYIFFSLVISSPLSAKNISIEYKWKLVEIVESDDKAITIPAGNYLDIDENSILEVMKTFGNRNYPYHREENNLFVTSGSQTIKWEIIFVDNNNLHLVTPIGTYILVR
ncbi:hypothetical protein OIZ54_01610 [Pseudoalteromonas sp. A3]|uniref:hypothetical protein n=1 Tax=Pseudoalteromonas TaxID=53246 RepID=UPI000BBC7609|nr:MULTISPECIES: hypothetical protein [Pseudoalteromonas]MCW1717436.1 hypothetical protein [Pseudoalteromonas sp. A3]